MRAMLLEGPAPIASDPLRPAELPDPRPGDGELVLDVSACAVCRTDLQICEGEIPLHLRPLVPGHQIVGRVLAVGPLVQGWRSAIGRVSPGSAAPAVSARAASSTARTSASALRNSPAGTDTAASPPESPFERDFA